MHREGTQILGITTLQLLLLTVTLRWTSLRFLRLDTLPSLKFNMANLTTYFITRLVSDQRAAKDFKNLNKKAAYPLFKDGHVQEIKTCIHQQHYYITAICIPEMKKTLQYHIKLILEKASGDIYHAQCGCPTKLPAHPCVAALLWTRVIKFTRDWSFLLPMFQLNKLNAAYFRGLQYPLSGLVASLQLGCAGNLVAYTCNTCIPEQRCVCSYHLVQVQLGTHTLPFLVSILCGTVGSFSFPEYILQ